MSQQEVGEDTNGILHDACRYAQSGERSEIRAQTAVATTTKEDHRRKARSVEELSSYSVLTLESLMSYPRESHDQTWYRKAYHSQMRLGHENYGNAVAICNSWIEEDPSSDEVINFTLCCVAASS